MMNKILVAIVLVALFGYMSLGIKSTATAPDNATVVADYVDKIYASPPCIINGTTDREYIENADAVRNDQANAEPVFSADVISIGEARAEGYRPDKACADADGFVHSRALLLSILGLTSDRWTDDGGWRW